MSKSMNQVILVGNLTRDPELRTTPSGQSVVNFSLALNRSYKDKDGNWQEATDFVDCLAWGKLAEQVQKGCFKGNRVLVDGRLQTSSWEQDGIKKNKTEVLANSVMFLTPQASSDVVDMTNEELANPDFGN